MLRDVCIVIVVAAVAVLLLWGYHGCETAWVGWLLEGTVWP